MKPESLISCIVLFLALSAAGSAFSQAPTPAPSPDSISPDKQWHYFWGDDAKVVKAGTMEAAVEFACKSGGLIWAPDSRRFAIACSGGKGSATLVYQLRNGTWETGDDALGNGDEIMDRAANAIKAQAKKKGLPKKTHLHMNRWTVEPEKWIDSSTLVVYAEMWEVAHTDDENDDHASFAIDLLVTLKFDDSGAWKIIKTRELSEKEVKQRESRAH